MRFYTMIAPHAGLRIVVDEPDHVQVVGKNFSFSLIDDERPLTEHVHLAFPAQDDATVRAFHAAALAAGYEDHGGPGERAVSTRATTARSSWTPTGITSRSSTTTAEPWPTTPPATSRRPNVSDGRSRQARQGRRPHRSTGGDRNEGRPFVARRPCSGAFVPGQSHRSGWRLSERAPLDLRRMSMRLRVVQARCASRHKQPRSAYVSREATPPACRVRTSATAYKA